ncbi:hypothetical protein IG631_20923 [Alternaria alternata]|nr:hypothetical protein IG631_20923 [Alternaria alternata]
MEAWGRPLLAPRLESNSSRPGQRSEWTRWWWARLGSRSEYPMFAAVDTSVFWGARVSSAEI